MLITVLFNLENCAVEDNLEEGAISMMNANIKMSDTSFSQNKVYDLYHSAGQTYFINRLDTYKCSFKHDNISLKSNVTNFTQAAVKEKAIGNFDNMSYLVIQETQYASCKKLIYCKYNSH